MLLGEFRHGLDAKGRIIFPAKLREDLGEVFYVTKSPEGCLLVYPQEGWLKLDNQLRSIPMGKGSQMQRYFFGQACEASADKQGRVNLPEALIKHAQLKKDVVIVGMSERVEVWDAETFDKMNQENELSPEEILAQMELLGI